MDKLSATIIFQSAMISGHPGARSGSGFVWRSNVFVGFSNGRVKVSDVGTKPEGAPISKYLGMFFRIFKAIQTLNATIRTADFNLKTRRIFLRFFLRTNELLCSFGELVPPGPMETHH